METGTGKTYVYLRTIPELNKRCGSTKFVIVVPSVDIKEGVYKSLQMTEAHFQALYSGYFLYESGIEAIFADPLQKNAAVKVYAKLPGWFRVPTPLGSYNPDWAVLIDADAGEWLYLVVENQGQPVCQRPLRSTESARIACGKVHFNALSAGESPARYEAATRVEELLVGMGVG